MSAGKDAPVADVVAGIVWREGRFLAVRRPPGKPLAGYWEFPGGKVEPGETLEQALARELAEELGLAPAGGTVWREARHDYPHLRVRLVFFLVLEAAGEPCAHEGHETAWLSPQEARGFDFLPADREIVEALCAAPPGGPQVG